MNPVGVLVTQFSRGACEGDHTRPGPVCRWTRSPGRATPRVQDCSRRPNHQGIPATASSAGDPPLEQNPSSAPPPAIQQGNHSIDGVFTQSGPEADIPPWPETNDFAMARNVTCRVKHEGADTRAS